MIEIAVKYHNLGFSTTVAKNKRPAGIWEHKQKERVQPDQAFLLSDKMGIITGVVSGGLEVIDFDLKYDLTKTLFEDFKILVNCQDNKLLEKMVVQKSQSGGYHFFYRCPVIEGNQKLATRKSTEQELVDQPKEKVKSMIETRGEGGFIMTNPSAGYEWFYKDLAQISVISPEERTTLLSCARFFNEVFVEKKPKKEYIESHNVFDEWNQRGDIEAVLEEEGWSYTGMCRGNRMYLRPNGTHNWSAGYHPDTRLLRIFTTNSDFQNDTTYNPSQVLATLKFGGKFKETAQWLEANGYGVGKTTALFSEVQIDDEHDFIASDEELDSYITQIRDGTFQMGLTTGLKSLDKHWLFKPAHLVLTLGHDNVGKSVFVWFLAAQAAKLHGWRWLIWAAENRVGGVKRKIIEFYCGKRIKDLPEDELDEAKAWFKKHFTVIRNNKLYTYKDMLNIGRVMNKKQHYDAFMIDPYNGLLKETDNEHMYDYRVMQEFLLFTGETKCCIYLNVHAITEALRRRYPKGHDLEGHPMPPHKADAEGGGKFSNKADDFLIVHRMIQHKDRWMEMEVHVPRIKETESGGRATILDEPVMLRMKRGATGYEEMQRDVPPHMRDWTESTIDPIIEQEKPISKDAPF